VIVRADDGQNFIAAVVAVARALRQADAGTGSVVSCWFGPVGSN